MLVIFLAQDPNLALNAIDQLAEQLEYAVNVHLDAVEHGNSIVFLYSVLPGAANQSYGVQVARLAGIPGYVLEDAAEKLKSLEQPKVNAPPADMQLSLFKTEWPESVVERELSDLDPDSLTPRQALDLIYKLKELAEKD